MTIEAYGSDRAFTCVIEQQLGVERGFTCHSSNTTRTQDLCPRSAVFNLHRVLSENHIRAYW
jgi:hypothetical protein